jgi:hypothetical protein
MSRDSINPHGFDEYRLAHESRQKSVDRILEYQADTRQRVDTLVKAILVLSGGALTISIGIFLRTGAPQLSADLVRILQQSWWLLFYSLAASATVLFIMIFQGYRYAAEWEKAFSAGDDKIAKSLFLQLTRIINWVLGVTGFVGFLVGLAMLAYVSVETVTGSPNSLLQEGRPQAGAPELKRSASLKVG